MNWLRFIQLAIKRQVGFDVKDYSNYSLFQEFQAQEIVKEINDQNIPLKNFRVLELAAGVGGYSPVLYRSCKLLVSTDIYRFSTYNQYPFLNFVQCDATQKYPFNDNSFDFIFCSSLIEHIENPKRMMQEVKRVLDDDGYLYISFPPFFSPNGGHYFSPFHLIGEKRAIKLSKKFFRDIPDEVTKYSNCWGEGRGLFRQTIRSVRKLLDDCGFVIDLVWPRFFMKINMAKIPILNEVLCWHVCFICRNSKQ